MKFKVLFITILSLLTSAIGFSQEKGNNKKDDLLFMLRQQEHINQALKTIDHLQVRQKTSLNMGEVVIIVCGEAVTSLTGKEAEAWVERLSRQPDVSILACGLSLAKFGKSEKDLVKGIGYTENGFIKAFELQKQGFLSVEL
jgi:intracellular sulfur oxidation DsrE/DsrF family protein